MEAGASIAHAHVRNDDERPALTPSGSRLIEGLRGIAPA